MAQASITTLKRRTSFQAQPEKAHDLTVAHKDHVIARSSMALQGLAVGGQDGLCDGGNLGMLQPSRGWPTDHCFVLCALASPAPPPP